jgi:predicted amidohydrolase
MKLALASLDQAWQDRAANLDRCADVLARSARHGALAAVLPEMTLTGFSMNAESVVEEPADSVSLNGFGRLAARSRIHVVFGACLRDGATRHPRNVLCHASPEGAAAVVYAKAHPFSFAGEDRVFEAGDALGFVTLPGLRLGASICYDLRFPALYAAMAPECSVILCIANWPASRIEHWHALLVARAIENQAYMIGVNRTGTDGNGIAYCRSSVLVSPEGRRLDPAVTDGDIDVYDIDPGVVRRYRDAFPTLRDRRPAFYRSLERGDPHVD